MKMMKKTESKVEIKVKTKMKMNMNMEDGANEADGVKGVEPAQRKWIIVVHACQEEGQR